MKTMVLGIGNDILRDDGIGPAVIRELERHPCPAGVFFESTNLSGMPLFDIISGFDRLIIVDAIKSGGKPGEIRWLKPDVFESRTGTSSLHKMDILRILELGRRLGLAVPSDVHVMTIEAYDVTNFGEQLTPEVAEVIPGAAADIMNKLTRADIENQLSKVSHPIQPIDDFNNKNHL